MATATFLGLPVEVRLVIYDAYLVRHQRVKQRRQPSNSHLQLLRTCRQIHDEALPIFWRYVSLRNELEINAFILNTSEAAAARVLWADVANDTRVFMPVEKTDEVVALLHVSMRASSVHSELAPLPCQTSISHFAGCPRCNGCAYFNAVVAYQPMYKVGTTRSMSATSLLRSRRHSCCPGARGAARLSLEFEFAMYPSGTAPPLSAYEIFMDAETRVQPFQVVSPRSVEKLRLSGEVRLPSSVETPALRQVTLHSITGNHFDRNALDASFSGAVLETFLYAQGHRLGFELRDRHLNSVIALSGSRLRTLVLLGCSRLSSATIAACLKQLPLLEVFALSLVTVDELRTNFLVSLPMTVTVLKLHVANAWYAVPLLSEERGLCDELENGVMVRERPPKRIVLNLRERLLTEDGRRTRMQELAALHHIDFSIQPWESDCEHSL